MFGVSQPHWESEELQGRNCNWHRRKDPFPRPDQMQVAIKNYNMSNSFRHYLGKVSQKCVVEENMGKHKLNSNLKLAGASRLSKG